MIIHSFDTFGKVRRFDPATGTISQAENSSTDGSLAVNGHYGLLGDTFVLFYRIGEDLYLRIGQTVLLLDNTTSITYYDMGDYQELIAKAAGRDAVRVKYHLPESVVAPEDDPTPFAEPEDFDFGLFISNVANNSERRSLIYRG